MAPNKPITLNQGEMRVLQLAWQCFKEMPTVDTKKLAELGGYKTPASANSVYCAAKKKLLAGAEMALASPGTPKAAKKTVEKSKKRALEMDVAADDDDDEQLAESPVSVKKARGEGRGKGKGAGGEVVKDEDVEAESKAGVKKEEEGDGVEDEALDGLEGALAGIQEYAKA